MLAWLSVGSLLPSHSLLLPLGPEPRGSTAPLVQLLVPRLRFSALVLHELNIPTTTLSKITFSPVATRAGAQFFHWGCSVPVGRRRVPSLPTGPGPGCCFFLSPALPAEAEPPEHFMNS